ncbi:tetratricopeptide repeat protein [bacterium]|nr:tetratricopeptide repeat protein [bacterium]
MAGLLLVILVTLVYAGILDHGFVQLDDDLYVYENPDIQLKTSSSLWHLLTSYYVGNFHPLTMLSYAVNYALSGLEPHAYHLTNLLLHLLNTFLVLIFLHELGLGPASAFLVALLFGINPVHVESVAWISERKDVLYAFFYILAMVFYLKSLHTGRKRLFQVLTFLAGLASMLSKSMAVTLPLVFLLLDYRNGRPFSVKAVLEKLHYFLLSGLFGVMALLSQSESEALSTYAISLFDRLVLLSHALMFYLVKLMLPFNLSVYHFYPEKTGSWLPLVCYGSLGALILLVWILYRTRRSHPELIWGGLFFLVSISLTLQFIPFGLAFVAERYTYIPSIGLFYGLIAWTDSVIRRTNRPRLRTLAILVFSVYLVFLGYATHERNKVWKDSQTLFSDIIAKYPDQAYGYLLRSNVWLKQKDYRATLADSEQALARDPKLVKAYINRGISRGHFKDFEGALADFEQALHLDPEEVEVFNNRGIVKALMHDYQGALSDFNRSIELDARNVQAYALRANTRFYLRDFAIARTDFDRAIELTPLDASLYEKRGVVQLELGETEQACQDWQHARKLGSEKVTALLHRHCSSP